jgi:uncharacterized protein YyaL (SSP411 family)
MKRLLRVVRSGYRPNRVLAHSGGPDSKAARRIPLLAAKTAQGDRPTAYVCRNYACQRPVIRPVDLAKQLDGETP